MAIEVIGKDDKAKFEKTCRNCASILRYTRSDIVTKKHTDISGVTEMYDVITCPSCGKDVEVQP